MLSHCIKTIPNPSKRNSGGYGTHLFLWIILCFYVLYFQLINIKWLNWSEELNIKKTINWSAKMSHDLEVQMQKMKNNYYYVLYLGTIYMEEIRSTCCFRKIDVLILWGSLLFASSWTLKCTIDVMFPGFIHYLCITVCCSYLKFQ